MSQRIIKRYSNRKLYDTKDSRYVTLLQIAEMVRAGEDVQIIDNNTKDDLTEVTLAQIIFEEQKANQKSLPLQTLKDLIHQRTERALDALRDGPIGRLIPGGDDEETPSESSPPAVEEERQQTAAVKHSLMNQAKETIEDFQHKIDDRVRAVMPTLRPWNELENQLRALTQRVQELEAALAAKGVVEVPPSSALPSTRDDLPGAGKGE